MKHFLFGLVLVALLAGIAQAQDLPRTLHRFAWTQPDSTCGPVPKPMADGWVAEYRIFLATPTDTTYYGRVDAPEALADTVFAYVSLQVGLPQSIRVLAVDKWGQEGCVPSEWSNSYIPIPDPPGQPSKPAVVD